MMDFKRLAFGFIIIVFLLKPCFAQGALDVSKPTRTVITGKILNYMYSENSTPVILNVSNSGDLVNGYQEVNGKVDKNGNFSLELFIAKLHTVTIKIDYKNLFAPGSGNWPILIGPGDSLHLDISSLVKTTGENISYSGIGSDRQLLLRDMDNAMNKLSRQNNLGEKVFKKEISFSQYYNASVQQAIDQKDILDSLLLFNKYNLDRTELINIRVYVLAKLYFTTFNMFDAADLSSSAIVGYYKRFRESCPLEDLLINDDLYYASGNLSYDRIFVQSAYLDYLVAHRLPSYSIFKEKGRDLSLEYGIINQAYKNKRFRSRLLAGFIILYGRREWNDKINSLAQSFYNSVPPNDPFRVQVELIEKQMNVSADRTKPFLAFSLPDASGKIRSSSEFKGKVILIDFMFYGCAGCGELTPYLEKLEKDFNGKNVVFLSISIDRTAEILKKGIGQYLSKHSIPLYTNGEGSKHDIIKFYSIKSYPTLILIDKNGHVVSTRAPDPRFEKEREKLIAMMNKALE